VGQYSLSNVEHGFLLSRGTFSKIDVPPALGASPGTTVPLGISPQGYIVGTYRDSSFNNHGFLLRDGTFTTIDVPPSVFTEPEKISPQGDIVGGYSGVNFPNHGFLLSKGNLTTIDAPGAGFFGTWAAGINPKGDIVGFLDYPAAAFIFHGFLLSKGIFTIIDVPGAISTQPRDINPFRRYRGHLHNLNPNFCLSWVSAEQVTSDNS
jgi:hypothetical protein